MKNRRIATLLVFGLLGALASGRAAGKAPKTIAVTDFAQRDAGREAMTSHRWLSKALSDLLISDLSVDPNVRVVTREHMHMLMQEAELRELSGLTEDRLDPETFGRMRQYLKVDYLVLGTFSVRDDSIRIETHVIAYESGNVMARFSREGALADALTVEKDLARKMMHFFSDGKRDADSWVLPKWTDSMEASEWLYVGVDYFDAGKYNQAWYAFRRAVRADPEYADAVYWIGRMYYYRQDYAHAHVLHGEFIRRFPGHARIGDAVVEYVHSRECEALSRIPVTGPGFAESPPLPLPGIVSFTPEEALELYRALRARDWGGVYVYNKVDYASRSPLSDWLLKREQQALAYMGRFTEAFELLETGLRDMPDEPADAAARSWREETRRLMNILAMESEDAAGPRLASEFLEARDLTLDPDHPVAEEDLRHSNLKGNVYVWGGNRRILAPPGHTIKTLVTTIRHTVDPDHSSACRLQIRRYRYVDIDTCGVSGRGEPLSREREKIVAMPYGLTWFYLRPEYNGHPHAGQAAFDGWRVEADMEAIPRDGGILDVTVENTYEYNTFINGVYTRCYDGKIPHLAPGTYTVSFGPMWQNREWGFEQLEHEVEVLPGKTTFLNLRLRLNEKTRAAGWDMPHPIASRYPTFKHRPRPDSNWRSGPPAIVVHPLTGEFLAVWSHLDDLWFSRSPDGKTWDEPDTLPPPVNSADAELNPRLLIDQDGRYCLLFLSNRGLFRNLASYISWSRNLRQWSRPVLLDPRHHNDHDLIQDNQGRYILLLTPAPRNAGGNAQDSLISLRISRDLLEWKSPVAEETWRSVFLREIDLAPHRENYVQNYRPRKARIVQDDRGIFHIIWCTRLAGQIRYRRSEDLVNWSPAEHIRNTAVRQPFDLAMTAGKDRLMVGLIAADEQYSGYEVFALSETPLRRDRDVTVWRPLKIPSLVVNGMPDLAYCREQDRWVVTWQIAERALHPSRRSGPVLSMQGNPERQKTAAPGIRANHQRLGKALQPYIERIQHGETLSPTELTDVRGLWNDYHADLQKNLLRPNASIMVDWQGRLRNHDYAAYHVNSCRISLIDPRWHGDRMMHNPAAAVSFSTLMDLLAAGEEKPELLAALTVSALFNESPGDSLRVFHRLNEIAPFWADYLRNALQTYAAGAASRRPYYPVRESAVKEFLMIVDAN